MENYLVGTVFQFYKMKINLLVDGGVSTTM